MSRLYYLKDHQASLQYAHTNYFQDFEAPDVMAEGWLSIHGQGGALCRLCPSSTGSSCSLGNPREWVFQKLRCEWGLIAFFADYSDAIPYLDRTLYLVTHAGARHRLRQ